METKQLGQSELRITPIGFGAWAIGGPWQFGWGPQDDDASISAIHAALDAGINWIDTAAIYGLGHSEEVVGKALKGRAERPSVFTKCARTWNDKGETGHSLKADSVRRELEASLRRLQTETIDLYQIHWPNPDPDIEEGWAELAKFVDEGKVRSIGVSNFSVGQMERARKIAPITSLQPPYSLVNRKVEQDLLPYAQEHKIGVIVYSPMQSGLLSGAMTRERATALPADDWRRRSEEFQEPRLSRNLQLVELLRAIGARHGRTPGEAAIAWTLHHPAVTGAIVGVRRPDQIGGVIGAMDFRLSAEEMAEIEAFQKESIIEKEQYDANT